MATADPSHLIRSTRLAEGLSQAALARRLGVTQPAVARLESAGDAISVATLARALGALGRALTLDATPRRSSIDETLLREQLRLSPAERLQRFEETYAGLREFAQSARSPA